MSTRHDTDDADIVLVRRMADVLDRKHVDPIIGLLAPGLGDALTGLIGLYAVRVAVRKRLPAVIVARMLINLATNAIVGAIPLFGDAFDFFHRVHLRNLRLLEARYERREATAGDWLFVIGAALLLLLALALPFILLILVLSAIL